MLVSALISTLFFAQTAPIELRCTVRIVVDPMTAVSVMDERPRRFSSRETTAMLDGSSLEHWAIDATGAGRHAFDLWAIPAGDSTIRFEHDQGGRDAGVTEAIQTEVFSDRILVSISNDSDEPVEISRTNGRVSGRLTLDLGQGEVLDPGQEATASISGRCDRTEAADRLF